MSATEKFQASDWRDIDRAISAGDVPAFPTKAAAVDAAQKFGWSKVFRFHRRFESVWVVGVKDFQNDVEADVEFQVIRVPLLRWDQFNGQTRCPVVKFRKAA